MVRTEDVGRVERCGGEDVYNMVRVGDEAILIQYESGSRGGMVTLKRI